MFQLPALPYDLSALEPYMSRNTLAFHHGKHHRAYVDKLNKLLAESPVYGREASLEEIVRTSSGPLFNQSAQAWNHTFFWHCLSPNAGDQRISRSLERAVGEHFGSLNDFYAEFTKKAVENFGSGWTWLVKKSSGELAVVNTANADTPLRGTDIPLLVIDVWEHAYYLDYQNARPKFLAAFQHLAHWKFASERFESHEVFNATKEMRGKLAA